MNLDREEKAIVASVSRNFERQLSFVQQLIAVPSLPGTKEEGDAQRIFRRELETLGDVEVDEWEPTLREVNRHPFHPVREPGRWSYEGRPNVVGVVNGGAGRSLLLNGHIDVVSPEPRSAWSKEPWKALVAGDRIYGRGSSDMKAGLSCILFAVKAIQDSGFRPAGTVVLQSVVEEEFGGGGTIAALQRGHTASAALVAEASGAGNLCMGSGGSRFIRVDVEGRSLAPQSFRKAVNAVEPAFRVFTALSQLNDERERRLRNRAPAYRKRGDGAMFGNGRVTNLVIGNFTAGDFPATVAGFARLEGRIGFPSPERGEEVKAEYEARVRETAAKDRWMRVRRPRVSWFNAQREPFLLARGEPIVVKSSEAIRSVLGRGPEFFATPSSTDAVFMVNRAGGVGGIPTVVYGPGGANAHGADEYVRLSEVRQVTAVIAVLIKRWCGLAKA